jgi:flavin reductase (DIM6/NTAB) family NADH-FMN oxidoreductase RutF
MQTSDLDRFTDGLDPEVFVVTAAYDGQRAGCLVGFATQASIDPPRMLVCLSVANHTYRLAEHADLLGVHLLGDAQHDLAELFGGSTGDEVDKFARCRWTEGAAGTPLLETPRRLIGRVVARHELGDHVGFLLDPVTVEVLDDEDALELSQAEDIEAGHPA